MARAELEAFFSGKGAALSHFKTSAENVRDVIEVARQLLPTGMAGGPAGTMQDIIGIAGLIIQYEKLLLEHPKK